MKVYENGVLRDATGKEIAESERILREAEEAEVMREPTAEERLAELESQNQMLAQCLMEMSQIVYA